VFTPDMQKQRHGCLTAWLIVAIILNSIVALVYLFGSSAVASGIQTSRGWLIPVLAALAAVNVACAVAIFLWKKWGFYGFAATSAVAFVVNLALGINFVQALFGLIGLAILYGVLQIGSANKGWPQLD
jgi:hypothetical protein